jgi:hypothetical protein
MSDERSSPETAVVRSPDAPVHARRPRVGSVAWERVGGPPLSLGERIALLSGTAVVVMGDAQARLRWRWSGRSTRRAPARIDLTAWAPPDSAVCRQAEERLRDTSSAVFVHHSFRAYYFSAVAYEAAGKPVPLDRETLYVATLLHDVGLFEAARPPHEHCFTVGSARETRRLMSEAGWEEARQDRAAMAIMANLNPFVSIAEFGPEAHFFSHGGLIEVLAEEWKVHPDNLAEILARHPRVGLAAETKLLVRNEAHRNPGCRFACFGPLFSWMVGLMSFRADRC